jgi:hypothetical protein
MLRWKSVAGSVKGEMQSQERRRYSKHLMQYVTDMLSLPSQGQRLTIPGTRWNYIFTITTSLVHLRIQRLFMLPFSSNGFSVQRLLLFCGWIIISLLSIASVVLVSTVARWSSHYIISFNFLLELSFYFQHWMSPLIVHSNL